MPTIGADIPSPGNAVVLAPLLTQRLRLRPLTIDDVTSVQHFLGNEELAKQTVNLPHPFGDKEALDWIQSAFDDLASGSGYTLAIERRPDGVLLGAAGLLVAPKVPTRAELGYWIARTYWGDGIATEAVNALIDFGREKAGLSEIWACAFSENTGSRRVLEKAGFQEDFTRTEDCPARGGPRSITYYGLD